MNQEKIGRFISELRKEKNMTQLELANRLGITDRAISKWENGRGMPDVSLFEPLCKELNISINELLKGEKIERKNIAQSSGETLVNYSKYLKQKEKRKNFLLLIAIMIVLVAFISILSLSFNKTFFETKYSSDFVSSVNIPIPNILIIAEQAEWNHTL